jgi:hypothetical protein
VHAILKVAYGTCCIAAMTRKRQGKAPRLGIALVWLFLAAAGLAESIRPLWLADGPRSDEEREAPLTIWSVTRTEPEPLAVHVARVDLRHPGLQVVAMVHPDPDGIAEASLAHPTKIAAEHGALVAVNANAFRAMAGPDGERPSGHRAGMAVEMHGVVVSGGRLLSGPSEQEGNNLCFFLDDGGRPRFGPYDGDSSRMREAVHAWWGDLVENGQVLPESGGVRHPRTAVGLDAGERWLYLVVVDGRQPSHSVGASLHELAVLMRDLGCVRAINLDGGGSSVLVVADDAGEWRVVNRPSGLAPRPVPVLLGVRSTQDS